jgi:hypothetical protein
MNGVSVPAIDGHWYISVARTNAFESRQNAITDDRPFIVAGIQFSEYEVSATRISVKSPQVGVPNVDHELSKRR